MTFKLFSSIDNRGITANVNCKIENVKFIQQFKINLYFANISTVLKYTTNKHIDYCVNKHVLPQILKPIYILLSLIHI